MILFIVTRVYDIKPQNFVLRSKACFSYVRYFTRMELRDLFVLDDTRVSTTQQQISQLHSHQRKSDTSLDAHIAFLHTLGSARTKTC